MADKYIPLEEETGPSPSQDSAAAAEPPPTKNPMEKVRVRLAAESYNGAYNSLDRTPATEKHDYDSRGSSSRQGSNSGEKTCTRAEKQLTILLVLCILVIAAMSVFLVLQRLQMDNLLDPDLLRTLRDCDNNGPPPWATICGSPACVETSGTMLAQMDLSVDPCDDFYEYACARGLSDPAAVPPDKSKWSIFSKLAQKNEAVIKKVLDQANITYEGVQSAAIEKAKHYYDVCMDASRREQLGKQPLFDLVAELGSWPLTDSQWKENQWQLQDYLAVAHGYGISPFFNIYVSADDKNSSRQAICFDQSGTTFTDYTAYSGNDTEKFHSAFIKYFTDIVVLLGADSSQAATAAEDVWTLEKQLSAIQDKPENRTDPKAMYHKFPLSEMTNILQGWLDVPPYMSTLFGEDIPAKEEVLIYAQNYMEKLGDIVTSKSKTILSNYLTWHLVHSLVPYMPLPYRLAQLELKHTVSGVQAMPPEWEECVGRTIDSLGFAVGALFIRETFTEEDKTNVEEILTNIRSAFEDMLPEVTWMDSLTRDKALLKAQAINDKIGYPDFIRKPAELDKYYEKLVISNVSEFENAVAVREFFMKKNLDKRKNVTDRSEWGMFPEEVNAYYSPSMNEIVFPAGILQKPFYDVTFPKALIYGAIGMVMGHELTHGFDNMGREFDKQGNLHNWWTNASSNAFKQQTQCLIDEYSQFEVYSQQLNGLTTLGENIADNGGLKAAYNAYQSWRKDNRQQEVTMPGLNMTTDRLFFLSFAQVWCSYYTPAYAIQSITTDPHSFAKYRVIGTLQNSPEFAKAYECPTGSKMNPENKCSVW